MSIRGLAIVIAVAIAAGTSTASAQPADTESAAIREARTRFELAEQHYEAGDFALALREFQQIHGLMLQAGHPNAPLVLFNVARCYAALDREAEAIDAYERFLADAAADAPNRDVAQAEVRELQTRREIRGESEGLRISPIGPIIGAVGVAAMIAGAITGGLALAAQADATDGCVDGRCPPELGPRADEAHLLANVTDGLLFGGLAVATVGIVLTFVISPESDASATAGCSGTGCAVGVGGHF